ncbi:MAG: 16S rRNA (guanine(527)-N(7))-methyltransferase RsmG [Rhodospirillales bacterium]
MTPRLTQEEWLTQEEFQTATGVSRETLERLAAFLELLRRWQARINLVSTASLDDPWRRHILDSAQLLPLIAESPGRLYDIGSGAGFPGLVLAILRLPDVHLIESDLKKAAFLREAARITETKVEIHIDRAEKLSPRDADIVTARGCAALPKLLELAKPLLKPSGICFFLKGRGVEAELTAARKAWTMKIQRVPSKSDPTGIILRLEGIQSVGSKPA